MGMKRRYLLIKIISERPLSGEQFGTAVTSSVRRFFGEIGLSRIDPKLVRFDSQESKAVVACRKEGTSELQAAIALISEASEMPISPLIVRISGTIKGLGRKK